MLFLRESVAIPAHDHRTTGHTVECSLIVGTAGAASEAQYVVWSLRDADIWRPPDSSDNLIHQRASRSQGPQRTGRRGPVRFHIGYKFVGKGAKLLHAVLPRPGRFRVPLRWNFRCIFFHRLTIPASIMYWGWRLGPVKLIPNARLACFLNPEKSERHTYTHWQYRPGDAGHVEGGEGDTINYYCSSVLASIASPGQIWETVGIVYSTSSAVIHFSTYPHYDLAI